MKRGFPIRKMRVELGKRCNINDFPNIDISGSVTGMKKLYWGEDAKVVRCGSYYYNVTRAPHIYEQAM